MHKFKPFKEWSLKQKLLVVVLAIIILSAVFLLVRPTSSSPIVSVTQPTPSVTQVAVPQDNEICKNFWGDVYVLYSGGSNRYLDLNPADPCVLTFTTIQEDSKLLVKYGYNTALTYRGATFHCQIQGCIVDLTKDETIKIQWFKYAG